jgi:hypothetical protein
VPTKIKVPKRVDPHSSFWGLFVERQRDRSFPERFFCEGSVVPGRDDCSFEKLDDSSLSDTSGDFFNHPSSKSAMHASRSSRSTRRQLRLHGKVVPPPAYDDSPVKRKKNKRITKPKSPSIQPAISKKATSSLTTRTTRQQKSSSPTSNKQEDVGGVGTAPAGRSR